MRILGIDPGLETTGYGVIDATGAAITLLEAGVITTAAKQPIQDRLKKIYRAVSALIAQFGPSALALEKLYSHYNHPVTALLMGHSRGVVCLASGEHDIPLVSYPSKRIRKAVTGNGSASKEQIQRMVQHILGLAHTKVPLDVTDALAVAIAYCYIERSECRHDLAYLRKIG